MIQPPTLPYSGTTLVLSGLSRYDRENGSLCCGPARQWLADCGLITAAMEIRTADEYVRPWRMGTERVIVCGETALLYHLHLRNLNAHRGYVYLQNGLRTVATYEPQDCCDVRDIDGEGEEDDAGNWLVDKDIAPTAWANRRFWFKKDIEKLFRPDLTAQKAPSWVNRATIAELELLAKAPRGTPVFFDIESHPTDNFMFCFSYAFIDSPVYTVCVYDHRGQLDPTAVYACGCLARFLDRGRIVIHNAGFDLPFMAIYHGVPFGRLIDDTMLMHHRAYPEAEKSLGHMMSCWINAPYHKDEGTFNPRNSAQYENLLLYNAKDVWGMRECWKEMWRVAETKPGLKLSMEQINRSVYKYLLAGLTGMNVDFLAQNAMRGLLRRKIRQYQRILDKLVGYPLNAGSNPQCVKYFHQGMGYAAVKKSEKTGAPSLAGDALYKLKTKHDNPAIDVILALREANKQESMLGFKPLIWRKGRT